MKILIIDGQGGKLGRLLAQEISEKIPDAELVCVGTNAIATSTMLKSGVKNAATGENAVRVCAKNADVITGPLGIVIADAMLGEITSDMAAAVGSSNAKKVLLPLNMCDNIIAGTKDLSLQDIIDDAVKIIAAL